MLFITSMEATTTGITKELECSVFGTWEIFNPKRPQRNYSLFSEKDHNGRLRLTCYDIILNPSGCFHALKEHLITGINDYEFLFYLVFFFVLFCYERELSDSHKRFLDFLHLKCRLQVLRMVSRSKSTLKIACLIGRILVKGEV